MLTTMGNKKDLIKQINDYLTKYKEDLFWGGELEFLNKRIHSLESSIAVVGQFSVGKSALLNALLGEDILATRKVESTKILTRIRHCKSQSEAKVILTYIDGKTSQLPLSDIKDLNKYTTFQGEDITDALQYVDVYWPVLFLNEELVLIDTPGANSTTASAFQTTREQLKTSSAIIYLFMGTKGLDAEDYALIQEFVANKKKVFLVGTNRDQLIDEQWQEVVQEVKSKMATADELKAIEIVGVSSLDALQGKQNGDNQLLQQSNIGELEKLLHQYMETRAYEQAELHSIENDLLKLLNEIDAGEAQHAQKADLIEADRKLRYDRLVALKEIEYSDVSQYGVQLLKKRENMIRQLNTQYEEKLQQKGNDILKSVKAKYAMFQKSLKEKNLMSLKVDALESSYSNHLNEVEKLYANWTQYVLTFGKQFAKDIENSVQQEDEKFLSMLKLLEVNVSIKWNDFEAILKQINLKPLQLQRDSKDFDTYNKKMNTNAENEQKLRQQIQSVSTQEQSLRRQKSTEESDLVSSQRREESSLGAKPKPREITRTKGILFWKRDEFVGYDNTEVDRWNDKYKAIHEKYRSKKRNIEDSYKRKLNDVTKSKQQIQREMDEIEEIEEQYVLELLGALYATVSNQSEIVKKLHSERMATVKEEWKLINLMQEERYYEHIQKIEDKYRKFIEQTKEKAIRQIQVL